MNRACTNRQRYLSVAAQIVALLATLSVSHLVLARPPASAPQAQATQASAESAKRSADAPVSAADISKRLDQLKSAAADSPDRDVLVEKYEAALADLKHADESKARAVQFDAERIALPHRLEQQAKAATAPEKPRALPAKAELADWETMLSAAEKQLQAARDASDAADEESRRRATRLVEIPKEIAAAKSQLEDDEEPVAGDLSPALLEAARIARDAKRRALKADVAALEKELLTCDGPSMELLAVQRDAAGRSQALLEEQLEAWRGAIDDRRRQQAETDAAAARGSAAAAGPAVRKLAEENSALADEREQVTESIKSLDADDADIDQRLEALSDEFKDIKTKVEVSGLTEAIGQFLRGQRFKLNQIDADRRQLAANREAMEQAQRRMFELRQQQSELRDTAARAAEILAELPPGSPAKIDDLRDLLRTQRKYTDNLLKDCTLYFNELVAAVSKFEQLLAKQDEYRQYIDEHVLWIKSARPLSTAHATPSAAALGWFVKPVHWLAAIQSLGQWDRQNPAVAASIVLGFAVWIGFQRRLRRAIAALGGGSLVRTAKALAFTVLIAGLWPAVIWTIGALLSSAGAATNDESISALATALQTVAAVFLPVIIARHICRRDGLAERHFAWPADSLAALRRQMRWLIAVGSPLVFVAAMLEAQANEVWKNSLGRIAFILAQATIAMFVFRTLRPPRGALFRVLVRNHEGWAYRLSLPIFLAALAVPIALIAVATTGYYYTALRLAARLEATTWLFMSLVVIQAVLARWLTSLCRNVAIEVAVADAASSTTAPKPPTLAAAHLVLSDEAGQIDLEGVTADARRLVASLFTIGLIAGLCLIWVDLLPALHFFDQVTLWTDAEHNVVSLADLFAAAAIALVTVVSVQTVPGLLEVAVLKRMPLDNGMRYALSAVARHAIAIVGLVLAAGAVGIGWPKVQWLAAAVTFGLGFGLQEIFANFVAGLIVLFERPIRVGDTVTVGDVTGVVSRIRIRATTITDGDRKELIVPNKEFITSKLVNWTLTDSVTRLVVRLAIAYGSDTQQVQRLLLRVAAETPTVLRSPGPKAVFMGFSDKALEFELRVFVGSVENLLPTRHQINMGIESAFRTAGVELSIPLREIASRRIGPQLATRDAA